MDKITFNYYLKFSIATILEWKLLLADDCTKDIIVDSRRFLVKDGRVRVYEFVIMPTIYMLYACPARLAGADPEFF
jgi:hypothetical protein